MLAALVSALHVLALGIGLGGVFARGRALRALAGGDTSGVDRVLFADNFWGVAALLWLATGLTRAFGGLERGRETRHEPCADLRSNQRHRNGLGRRHPVRGRRHIARLVA